MSATLPDRVPDLTNKVLVGIAGTISSQWEKFTTWLVTGLGATLALILANLDKAKGMLDPASASSAIKIFVIVLIFHTAQRVLTASVASGVAGLENPTLKALERPLSKEEAWALMDNMEAAYFPPFSWMINGAFVRLRKGEVLHVGTRIVRLALYGTICAAVQVCLAVWLLWILARGLP